MRDTKFTHPVSIDPRKDTRIWAEAIKSELAFQRRAPNAQQLAAQRGGNDLHGIKELRNRLIDCTADYLWECDWVDKPPSKQSRPPAQISAMAELAMGVGDAETSFLRSKPGESPQRRARTGQQPTLAPWQMTHDISYWRKDSLDRWKAEQTAHVLEMPPQLPPVTFSPATISGKHSGSVEEWRQNKVALSQWEISDVPGYDRAESLVRTNKLAEKRAMEQSKAELKKLMSTALRVSAQHPSPTRAKWYER